jgi:transposase
MHVLSDAAWAAISAALEVAKPARGRPSIEDRRTIEGIVSRHQNGAEWRAVPAEYGPWHRCAQRFIRWGKIGVWERLFEELKDAGEPDLAELFMDGSVIRAHQKAGGARRRTKGGSGRFQKGTRSSARRSAAPRAASAPRPASSATGSDGRSPSPCSPAKATS